MFLDVNPIVETFKIVRLCWHYCWSVPFSIPFFYFPFTFGHVIYGSIVVDVVIAVIYKMLTKGEYNGTTHGFWSPSDRGIVLRNKKGDRL